MKVTESGRPAAPAVLTEQPGKVPETQTGDLIAELLASSTAGNPAEPARIITGHLQGIDDEGRLLFVEENGPGVPVPVGIGVVVSDGVLVPAARNRQRALVVRTSETPARLLLVGLVRERIDPLALAGPPGRLEVKIDGETLRLTAEHEIELKCGNASLVMRRSGRVILKGTHVVTSSRGPVKIKGATIALN